MEGRLYAVARGQGKGELTEKSAVNLEAVRAESVALVAGKARLERVTGARLAADAQGCVEIIKVGHHREVYRTPR